MKIAILGSRGIPARYGGFETFAEQLATRLVKRGHRVTVFCEDCGTVIEEYEGVKLRHIKVPQFGALNTVAFDAACLWQARSGFDVIYMLGYGASIFCWLPRVFGSQVWINMDGLEWARTKWTKAARFYLRCAEAIATCTPNRIIADATSIKMNLQARYRKMPPCDVIPYGCEVVTGGDVGEINKLGLSPNGYYLLVCRFEPENHVREIVEGFLISHSNARLVLVGDHLRKNDYVQSLAQYGDGRLLFTGPIYDPPLIRALRYFCRGYLHGHSVGGTNPTLLEAMGCANVVIAHENSFNREVLGDGALFFSTPADVGAAIDSIEAGTVDTSTMRNSAVERAIRFYTWERIADHYCELMAIANSEARRDREVIHSSPLVSGQTPSV